MWQVFKRPAWLSPDTRWQWGLVILTVVALSVRLYRIESNPAVLNPDEASVAYNALLLSEIGRDEWGEPWPLVLEAFGDQKIAGYTAMVAGLFSLAGYHDVLVRLPSWLAGMALIPLTAYLVAEVSGKRITGLWAAFMIAVMPVFFFYSRTGFEAMVSLVWILGLIWLLTKPPDTIGRAGGQLLGIVLLMSLSILYYNSPLVILPFLAVVPWMFRSSGKYWWVMSLGVGAAWGLWMLGLMNLLDQKSRITIFSDATVWAEYLTYRQELPTAWVSWLGSRHIYYGQILIRNYVTFWQPGFLLDNAGGHPWHALPGEGYLTWPLYLGAIVAMGISLMTVIRKRLQKKELQTVGLWWYLTAVSLIASAIGVNAPHVTRSLLAFVGVAGLIAWLLERMGRNQFGRLLLVMGSAWVLVSFGGYVRAYMSDYPQVSREVFHDKLFPELEEANMANPGKTIYVVDERGFDYIRAAWYGKFPPEQFFQTIEKAPPDTINFKRATRLNKWQFIRAVEEVSDPNGVVVNWDGANWIITNTYGTND